MNMHFGGARHGSYGHFRNNTTIINNNFFRAGGCQVGGYSGGYGGFGFGNTLFGGGGSCGGGGNPFMAYFMGQQLGRSFNNLIGMFSNNNYQQDGSYQNQGYGGYSGYQNSYFPGNNSFYNRYAQANEETSKAAKDEKNKCPDKGTELNAMLDDFKKKGVPLPDKDMPTLGSDGQTYNYGKDKFNTITELRNYIEKEFGIKNSCDKTKETITEIKEDITPGTLKDVKTEKVNHSDLTEIVEESEDEIDYNDLIEIKEEKETDPIDDALEKAGSTNLSKNHKEYLHNNIKKVYTDENGVTRYDITAIVHNADTISKINKRFFEKTEKPAVETTMTEYAHITDNTRKVAHPGSGNIAQINGISEYGLTALINDVITNVTSYSEQEKTGKDLKKNEEDHKADKITLAEKYIEENKLDIDD